MMNTMGIVVVAAFDAWAAQTAPVGTGQGHVRIRGMTVGGTAV